MMMDNLDKEIMACKSCMLAQDKKVIGYFGKYPKVIFVGEGPGQEEMRIGTPFVGPAGKLLDIWINSIGLTSEEYVKLNAVKCMTSENRTPNTIEIQVCGRWLDKQLDKLKEEGCTKIIVLGKTAARSVINLEFEGILNNVGKIFDTKWGQAMLLVHPSYVIRGNMIDVPTYKMKSFIEGVGDMKWLNKVANQ